MGRYGRNEATREELSMFAESADIYDLIYAEFTNCGEESERLAALIRRVNP